MSRFELLFSVLFFMKEKIDFSQPILMREREREEKKHKTKPISKHAEQNVHFLSHTRLKEPSS